MMHPTPWYTSGSDVHDATGARVCSCVSVEVAAMISTASAGTQSGLAAAMAELAVPVDEEVELAPRTVPRMPNPAKKSAPKRR